MAERELGDVALFLAGTARYGIQRPATEYGGATRGEVALGPHGAPVFRSGPLYSVAGRTGRKCDVA